VKKDATLQDRALRQQTWRRVDDGEVSVAHGRDEKDHIVNSDNKGNSDNIKWC
jgi:hypothetical protein